MKTILPIVPMPSNYEPGDITVSNINASFASNLEVETGDAYSLTLRAPANKVYHGSLKVTTEESANNAGTRRLLLKVEIPLASPVPVAGQNCCCSGDAADGTTPTVSAHVVITVPKAIAAGITSGDVDARTQVTAAVRLLQAAFSNVCHRKLDVDNPLDGETITENVTLVCGPDELTTGQLIIPIRYDADSSEMVLDRPISADAPIMGMIGGLRSLS